MRKILIAVLAIALLVPSLEARRSKAKAGSVNKDVYTDKSHDFSLKILENWSYSIGEEDDPARLVLTQDNPGIPPEYLGAEDYTMYPRLVIIVGESNLNAFSFIDSLLSSSYDSEVKKDAMKDLEILRRESKREEIVTKKKSTVGIGNDRAVLWIGQANYAQDVSESASDLGGKRVYGAYTGAIWVVSRNGKVYIVSVVSEQDFFDEVLREAGEMVGTISFGAEQDTQKKEQKTDEDESGS